MDVRLPNGTTMQNVPDGTGKSAIMKAAIANGLATQADFDVADHTAKYSPDISAAEQANGIPPGLLASLISKESSGNPDAVSSKGAIGLGQTLPTTLADMGFDEQETAKNPQLQIAAAGKYLGQMLQATGGDVTRALTAYHSGLGNLAKYESGEKQMGPETAGYATDPRFARFTQQQQQQQQPQDPQAAMNAQTLAQVQNAQPIPQPAPEPTLGEDVEQAAKGILQAGVNVANIPGSVVNTGLQAAGVPEQYQVPTLQLPQNMQPTDPYAKLGAEIGPYLVPLPGAQAESLASAAGRGADALIPKIAQIIDRQAPQIAGENAIGALAQNASSGNQNQLGPTILGDTGASVAVRAVAPVAGRIAQAVQDLRGARQGAAGAADVARAENAAEAAPAGAAPEAEPAPAGSAAPQPAPASAAESAIPEGGSNEEEALRNLVRTARPNDPALANSLDGLNIQPRPEVQQAAERLGMANDLLPSHLSGNAQYQAVEQAIKSRTGSALQLQEDSAIRNLAEKSGKLIDNITQADSSAALSARLNNEYDARMTALERRSNQLYQRVDDAMPQGAQVDAPNTASLLDKTASDLGGWENLGTVEQKVFKAVNPAGEKMPNGDVVPGVLTYARLNRVRQDVGAALYKNEGVYKDGNRAVLQRIYGALSEDQRAALGDVGARRDFEVANRLVQMRKTLEDQMMGLRGKDLSGDATRKAHLAVQALGRGDSSQFRRIFEGNGKKNSKGRLPLVQTRAHRQQLIADAIGEQLSAGRRGSDYNAAGFADWYGNLQKSGGLALIAKHMPGDFMAKLKDLHTVADAIRRAKSKEITTGKLSEFTERFDRVSREAALISEHATKAGAFIGGLAGPIGSVAGVAAGGKLSQVAQRLGGAESSAAAEKLIATPAFQAQVRRLAGASPERAESIGREVEQAVKKIPAYREFIQSLPKGERVRLARLGLIGWVNASETDQG